MFVKLHRLVSELELTIAFTLVVLSRCSIMCQHMTAVSVDAISPVRLSPRFMPRLLHRRFAFSSGDIKLKSSVSTWLPTFVDWLW